ncbi:hypothetical protein D8L93_09000, partial [Sodalis-like symbiont of Bactericera trigonica]
LFSNGTTQCRLAVPLIAAFGRGFIYACLLTAWRIHVTLRFLLRLFRAGPWPCENPGTSHSIYGSLVQSPAGGPGVIVAAPLILRNNTRRGGTL